MRVLGLNTAWSGCEVALVDNGRLRAGRSQAMVRGQDAHLPGLVSDVCDGAGLSLRDLERLAVVVGPGSFTGIRVGVAFARGLALALNVPCLGITSLEAALPEGSTGSAMVLLQAQRRPPDITYWVQSFRNDMATTPAEEVSQNELIEHIRAHPHRLFGDTDALKSAAPELTLSPAEPSARRAALIAATRDPSTAPPRPAYVRAPDATPRATQSS